MPDTKKAHQVFISYNNDGKEGTDSKTAKLICNTLESKGIKCWIAPRDIEPGEDWADEISEAISRTQILILILSDQAQKSKYVKMEITQASEEKVRIIPFCIENVKIRGGLRLLLSTCQWINAYDGPIQNHLDQLVETLMTHLGITRKSHLPPTPYEIHKPINKSKETKTKQPENDRIKEHKISQTYKMPEMKPDMPPEVQEIQSKAKKVYKSDKGYWEAEFEDNLVMIHIPVGEFIMGSDDHNENEKPAHPVFLDGYWIGKYTVTFAQYDRYCIETNQEKPEDKGWGRENRPVINVTWGDAKDYCEWLTVKYEFDFTLPTEAQWEKAARGTEVRIYPWGNKFDKSKCNSCESGIRKTQPVGSYPKGASPYGALDMAGNVWEWCHDWYEKDYYKKGINDNPKGPNTGSHRVIRGGGWFYRSVRCRTSSRAHNDPQHRLDYSGFRLVVSF